MTVKDLLETETARDLRETEKEDLTVRGLLETEMVRDLQEIKTDTEDQEDLSSKAEMNSTIKDLLSSDSSSPVLSL